MFLEYKLNEENTFNSVVNLRVSSSMLWHVSDCTTQINHWNARTYLLAIYLGGTVKIVSARSAGDPSSNPDLSMNFFS